MSRNPLAVAAATVAAAGVAYYALVVRAKKDDDTVQQLAAAISDLKDELEHVKTTMQGGGGDGAVMSSSPISPGASFKRQRTKLTESFKREHHSVLAAAAKTAAPTTKMVWITDAGQDLDDEMALIMARHLAEQGLIELLGVVATLTPAYERARLCRGTLDVLGFHGVRVAIGSDGGDTEGDHKDNFIASSASYTPRPFSESAFTLEPALPMLHELYRSTAGERCISLVVIASFKDAALFLRDFEKLFVQKTKEVVIMGGVKPLGEPGVDGEAVLLEPDSAHNNTFDKDASAFFYRRCQELGVPLVVVTRFAAYAAKMPRDVYDELALSGSAIGWRLRNVQRSSIEQLWKRACAPPDTEPRDPDSARKGLPARCDRAWFIKTFCGGRDDPTRSGEDACWDLVDGFMQYDTMAVLAAVPALRDALFAPRLVPGLHATNLLIGEEHAPGVSDPKALVQLLQAGFSEGLALNHRQRTHVIIHVQLRWENLTDVRLTLIMLRALWGVGKMDCVGVLLTHEKDKGPARKSAMFASSPDEMRKFSLKDVDPSKPGDGPKQEAWKSGRAMIKSPFARQDSMERTAVTAHATELASMLAALGMSHVTVCVDDPDAPNGEAAVSHLLSLYEEAPPIGVTLVATSTATAAAKFAKQHPRLFRERTVRVVHMGGALVAADMGPSGAGGAGTPTGAMKLQPDPAAQNNSLDMDAADALYELAQQLSVPMAVVSRHLSRACCVPTTLFDELGEFGGELGRVVKDEIAQSFAELYKRACATSADARRGLPERCDKKWFENTFCDGQAVGSAEAVWVAMSSINLYNPLVLLAALPVVEETYLKATAICVRSAHHKIIGMSAEVGSGVQPGMLSSLRRLLYSCFFFGATANASNFALRDGLQAKAKRIELDHQGREQKRGGKEVWVYDPPRAIDEIASLLGDSEGA